MKNYRSLFLGSILSIFFILIISFVLGNFLQELSPSNTNIFYLIVAVVIIGIIVKLVI